MAALARVREPCAPKKQIKMDPITYNGSLMGTATCTVASDSNEAIAGLLRRKTGTPRKYEGYSSTNKTQLLIPA